MNLLQESPGFSPNLESEHASLERGMFHDGNTDNSRLTQAQTMPWSARLACYHHQTGNVPGKI